MKKLKKWIACLLIMTFITNLIVSNAFAENNNKTIIVDGHIFEVVTNTDTLVSIVCTENGITYYETMNKITKEVAIKETKNTLLFKETVASYNVKINSFDQETVNYTVKDNVLKTTKEKKEKYRHFYDEAIKNNKNNLNDGLLHGQTVIDIGIALIILLAVIIILSVALVVYSYQGIDYEYWTDVIDYILALPSNQQKIYYYACIFNNYVLVGNAFSDYAKCLDYAKKTLNSSIFGVYTYKRSFAISLAAASGSYYGSWPEELHGSLPAFQYHTHPMKTYDTHYNEHIWFSR